jgi:oligopeptidase A
MTAANPLLAHNDLPAFGDIRPEHVVPAVTQAIADHKAAMADLAAQAGDPGLLSAKAQADIALGRVWGVVEHLLMVANTPDLRAAHAEGQPLIDAHYTEVGQDRALYEALAAIDPDTLDSGEQRALKLALQAFELSGVALEGQAREDFAANRVEQGRLETEFSNAVLDATQAWHLEIHDEARLAGLSEADRAGMEAAARAAGQEAGWRVTLHAPSVMAVLSHADDRALRQEVYTAWNTRASDQGPNAGQFDNGPRIAEILERRGRSALALGFADPVAVSLSTKMARDADEVEQFLSGLAGAARPRARAELDDLGAFARDHLKLPDMHPWDVSWVGEAVRRDRHALDTAEIRRYLPLPRVLEALFGLVHELFGVEVRAADGAPVWHPDVRHFTLHRAGVEAPVAALYADFYAREGKRGGAWMDVCRVRRREGGSLVTPVAYLITNFAPPVGGKPATLQHNDMVTLFHEMGHCLHHLLGEVDLASIGGIAGVEWDAVELPSQFLENFAWEPATLKAASSHDATGEPLSDQWIERMLGARKFLGAMGLVRQVEFALFDLAIHRAAGGDNAPDPMAVLNEVRSRVSVIDFPAWHRFPHSFTHIFAGGYAAGYYSYLWAERLSADAYAAFEESPENRHALGEKFRLQVLSRGGTRDALTNFIAFRGREPDNEALLESWGVAA